MRELATLVETEALLDRALAAARDEVAAMRADAERRASELIGGVEAEIRSLRAELAATIEREAKAALHTLNADAAVQVARYEAMTGTALDPIADRLAERLVAIAAGDEDVS